MHSFQYCEYPEILIRESLSRFYFKLAKYRPESSVDPWIGGILKDRDCLEVRLQA
jgi:hypothetical protein